MDRVPNFFPHWYISQLWEVLDQSALVLGTDNKLSFKCDLSFWPIQNKLSIWLNISLWPVSTFQKLSRLWVRLNNLENTAHCSWTLLEKFLLQVTSYARYLTDCIFVRNTKKFQLKLRSSYIYTIHIIVNDGIHSMTFKNRKLESLKHIQWAYITCTLTHSSKFWYLFSWALRKHYFKIN